MTLRVTLEIVPFGEEDKKRVIETINISNLGMAGFSDYEYVVEHNDYKNYDDDTPRVYHPREDGAIALAFRALRKIDNEENGNYGFN